MVYLVIFVKKKWLLNCIGTWRFLQRKKVLTLLNISFLLKTTSKMIKRITSFRQYNNTASPVWLTSEWLHK